MAKKSGETRSRTKPQPEPAQLKAIERLLDTEAYNEAVQRIRPLLSRFPDHGGLHRSLVEALQGSEGDQAAGLAAFKWAERRPNSLLAQETLLRYATALGHLLLAEDTASKVRELGGETPGFPIDPALKETLLRQPDGSPVSGAVMRRFDIGKLHLEGRDLAGVLHWLDGLELQPARNNRALALFHQGRAAEALEAFLANWEADGDNLFALGWAARLRLYLGDETGAQGLCTPLATAHPRRMEDALLQLDALLLLGQDGPAWAAFERARSSDWFASAGGPSGTVLRHCGACAASRLGLDEYARRLWQEALTIQPRHTLAQENLERLTRKGKAPSFPVLSDFHQALPMNWTQALYDARGEGDLAVLDTLKASNAYLKALYVGGDETFRRLIGFVLRRRAQRSDGVAVALLRELARLPVGTEDERFGFLSFLQTEGLIGRDETVSYWDGEQLREVRIRGTEIYRDPKESDLPPDLTGLMSEAITLANDRLPDAAETRLQAILERIPDHPVALGNLAAVRSQQGRHAEAMGLLREVVAKHPDYLFGRCNLAKTLIEDGKLEEADTLLRGLSERERLHIQEAFAIYGALAMLSTARGDVAQAQSLLASLERMVEDEDDRRRMDQVTRAVARLAPGERFKRLLGAAVKGPHRPARPRR